MDHFEFFVGNVLVRVHQGFRGEPPKIVITPTFVTTEMAVLRINEKDAHGNVEIELIEHVQEKRSKT